MNFEESLKRIEEANNIALFAHINPDADTLCSCIAMKLGIEKKYPNKKIKCFCSDTLHNRYKILGYDKYFTNDEEFLETCDLLIAQDVSTSSRLGNFEKNFISFDNTIQFDHHPGNIGYANINIVNSDCPANVNIVYEFLAYINCPLDSEIASSLYAGLVTDTVCFTKIRKEVLTNVTTQLIDILAYNVDYSFLNEVLFSRKTKNEFLLYKMAFEKMKLLHDDTVMLISFRQKDFEQIGATYFDTVSIISFFNSFENIKIAVLASEVEPMKYSVSFRSKGIDVSKLASVFGGGGHKCASGCNIWGGENTILKKLTNEIDKVIQKENENVR